MTTIPADIQTLIDQEMALGYYETQEDLLRHALETLRSEREALICDGGALEGIKRGLADVEAGRYKTLEQYDRDFRERHGIRDDV